MPNWKKLFVESNIPESLAPLKELSRNLWWVWNTDARDLFRSIDAKGWEESAHNPVVMLDNVSYQRYLELEKDKVFLANMNVVAEELHRYLARRCDLDGPKVAYFCMEYGLHDCLKIFSGGLGILAGDYLKEASDSRLNMVAVGLLYRYGYFKQVISMQGDQMANYDAEEFSKIPVQPAFDSDGNWVHVEVDYPGRTIRARVWEAKVGTVSLYLLDADFEDNRDEDRFVTHHLYGGDNENRLKQEMLLGLGGIRALRKLGHYADVYHCNEGHAAMLGLERIAELLRDKGLSFGEAKEVVRASTLFTTHTPVPAGHDSFHQDLFRAYMNNFAERLNLDWEQFVMLGKSAPAEDRFNMSYLAANLSHGVNGVSMLHGDVSKIILKNLYEGYLPEELEIGYVTNGVHYSSWAAPEWKEVHLKYFGKDFVDNQLDFDRWDNIFRAPDEVIWNVKKELKVKMISYIKSRFATTWIKRHENPKLISNVLNELNPDALTIGFARRFATYKRAHLLFRNLNRLAQIVNNPDRPVQFIFAGKAHPADKAGQDLIRSIVEISNRPEFVGKILFVQNYDINLAKKLVQGVDVWLNTPTRPLEASGTSGEKAAMNGTIHFSVLDGWWVEGYKENAGWALPQERSYEVQDYQDELDADTIYNILEEEIIPKYYQRNNKGVSEDWVGYVKNTIALVASNFTTARMLRDYRVKYYEPQAAQVARLSADNFTLARQICRWKEQVLAAWDKIEVLDIQIADGITNVLRIGEEYPALVRLGLDGLSPDSVGLEMVVTESGPNDTQKLVNRFEFAIGAVDGSVCTYTLNLKLMDPGAFAYGLRLFPKNPELPHRQDFKCVKWL
ncbi:MAG: alpha-glucan family phosphorylase [Bacteroidales bacterium]|nr:alpha-glucan family phosphorylase [Bacteroidales bacterium]